MVDGKIYSKIFLGHKRHKREGAIAVVNKKNNFLKVLNRMDKERLTSFWLQFLYLQLLSTEFYSVTIMQSEEGVNVLT